jgi:stage V sporulation protein SpoVS
LDPPESHQKKSRARMIAIGAGAITVVAIMLAFASGYLGQQWNWLRPAGELLLLAELVG